MPLYTFELRGGSDPIGDRTGVDLPDRGRAWAYTKEVARELMFGVEDETRACVISVYENNELVFELPFAAVDRTLDHLRPELRRTVESVCNSRLLCREAVNAAGATIREARALVARSRGKPYLAAIAGKPTIR